MTFVCRQAPPSSPLLSISVKSSNAGDFRFTLACSISGDLDDDYTLAPSGTDEINLIAKKSHKSRFHQVQAERDLLIRSQIYNEILSELNLVWWKTLPLDVQNVLSARFNSLAQLPTIFSLWYLEWNKAFPEQFPLPPSMLHFGRVKKPTNFTFVFDPSGQESQLSKMVTTAWDAVPESTRDLMLLCWSGLNSIRYRRNKVAHPAIKLSSDTVCLPASRGPCFSQFSI